MKSRKVKAYQTHKKVKADLTLDESDSDVNPDSFFHDEIEDFNNEKDNQLSTDDELIQHKGDSSEEEEVLPITDGETDEDESDDDEKDLPNREAWGKKKSVYYSTDFVDEDRGRTYREDDAEAAKAEADEAYAIQKSNFKNINITTDNWFANCLESSEDEVENEENVDLKSASKEEKMKYLETETKILDVCKGFKSSIGELKKFSKLLHLIETKKIRSKNLENYIRTKNGVLSLYCLNLSMYMTLASSGKISKYHPVVQRMLSYEGLLEELKSTDSVVEPTIDNILEKESQSKEVDFCTESEDEDNLNESIAESLPKDSNAITKEEKKIKKAKGNLKHVETENERQVMALISEVKEEMKKRKHEESDEEEVLHEDQDEPMADQDENNPDEKRFISYQIAKNKGLAPRRKKEYRNPRVRNRMKVRRANIRRKGQIRNVIKENRRYDGEPTGININVVKSVKFK